MVFQAVGAPAQHIKPLLEPKRRLVLTSRRESPDLAQTLPKEM